MALPKFRNYYFKTNGTDSYGNLFPQRVVPENTLLPIERNTYPLVPSHYFGRHGYPMNTRYYYGPPCFRRYIPRDMPVNVKIIYSGDGSSSRGRFSDNKNKKITIPYKYIDKFMGDIYMASLVPKGLNTDEFVDVQIKTPKYETVSFKVPKLQLTHILKDPRYNSIQYWGPNGISLGINSLINELLGKLVSDSVEIGDLED